MTFLKEEYRCEKLEASIFQIYMYSNDGQNSVIYVVL